MTYHHAGAQPVYAPNAKGGPVADPNAGVDVTWSVAGEELGRGRERDEGAGQLKVTDALLPPVQVVVEAPTHDIV
jgi:hypothetical protein